MSLILNIYYVIKEVHRDDINYERYEMQTIDDRTENPW